MALRTLTIFRQSFVEGDVTAGVDYDDVDLKCRVLWGRATFSAGGWKVTVTDASTGEGWSGNLSSLNVSKNLTPQQRIQLAIGSEGELINTPIISVSPA